MRTLKYLFLALVGLSLMLVAVANRELVTLKLLPRELADLAGFNMDIQLPLFLVILGGVVVGLLVGFVWEWLREHKHRRDAARGRRDVSKLEHEVTKLKKSSDTDKDEVLALLEDNGATR